MTRGELHAALIRMAQQVEHAHPRRIEAIARKLAAVEWRAHVTDDIYRCEFCCSDGACLPGCAVDMLPADVVREEPQCPTT